MNTSKYTKEDNIILSHHGITLDDSSYEEYMKHKSELVITMWISRIGASVGIGLLIILYFCSK